MANLIFKSTTSLKGEEEKELISVNRNFIKAILECIKRNFITIENVFPFYDSEDERGNNLYFKDTPQGKFQYSFRHLCWYDHKTLKNFNNLDSYDVRSLKNILRIQNELIYPDYNGDYKETFYYVETWKIQ